MRPSRKMVSVLVTVGAKWKGKGQDLIWGSWASGMGNCVEDGPRGLAFPDWVSGKQKLLETE